MTVAFSQLLPAFQGSAPASSDPFTPGAAGNTGVYFDFTGDGPDQNLQMTGTGSWPSQAQFNTSSSATFAMQANIAMSGASQTVSLTDTAAGFVAAIIGVEYSGVAAMSGAVITEIDAPGTGPGAILGVSVAVPAGAILVAVCVDPINSETITGVGGTSRGSSVFNPSYRVQEYAGTGADVQPSFTTSANGSAIYYVYQLLLSPPMASSLKYVSSPLAVTLQSYYSAASSGFTTYGAKGDGTQPPGTGFRQSITLAASAHNVVDVDACTWLASWITAFAADPVLSQIAINGTLTPEPGTPAIPVVVG